MPLFQSVLESEMLWALIFGIGVISLFLGLLQSFAPPQLFAQFPAWLAKSQFMLWVFTSLGLLWLTLFALTIWTAFVALIELRQGTGNAETQAVSIGAQNSGLGGLGLGAILTALLSAPFLIWATVIKQNALNVSRLTFGLSDTALFNEKVNAALQGLYSRRQVTRVIQAGTADEKVLTEWEDDIVQRNGAIDRLEGLARERPSAVPRIANMLSVYVRELSKVSEPQTHTWQKLKHLLDPPRGMRRLSPDEAMNQLGLSNEDRPSDDLKTWAEALRPFRTDVEKAVQTLGRLRDIAGVDQQSIVIDLRGANMQGFDLSNLCFDNANLSDCRMEGVSLNRSRMRGAQLNTAHLEGAKLSYAKLEHAHFLGAQMDKADLSAAALNGSDLRFVQFFDANLILGNFRGADLSWAKFSSSSLLNEADFSTARAQNVDLSASRISMEQINSMFGDASVTLPNNITPTHPDWPEHWPKETLDGDAFNAAYNTWLASQP